MCVRRECESVSVVRRSTCDVSTDLPVQYTRVVAEGADDVRHITLEPVDACTLNRLRARLPQDNTRN